MEMIDTGLDSSQEGKVESPETSDHIDLQDGDEPGPVIVTGGGPGTLTLDANGQYRLTTEQGQVTYRVVQVGSGDDGQIIHGSQVIGNPYASDEDTKISYIPTVAGSGEPGVSLQDGNNSLGQVSSAGGQFYVMMSPQDVLQAAGQRIIAPRSSVISPRVDSNVGRTVRDERRRASHNEVERRRRDKINNWIVQLSKCIPDCNPESKTGQVSKGGILAKACEYIAELRQTNAMMAESVKEVERLNMDNELLRQQLEDVRQENDILRTQLQQHGFLPAELGTSDGT